MFMLKKIIKSIIEIQKKYISFFLLNRNLNFKLKNWKQSSLQTNRQTQKCHLNDMLPSDMKCQKNK